MVTNSDPLRKQAYSNIKKISSPKLENFQIKISDNFHISAQNIDCGYSLEPPQRGGSNEYPQFIFFSRNKKNNVYPFKPQFYYTKVGFKGVEIIKACFRDETTASEQCLSCLHMPLLRNSKNILLNLLCFGIISEKLTSGYYVVSSTFYLVATR